jgi:hypothetical protein
MCICCVCLYIVSVSVSVRVGACLGEWCAERPWGGCAQNVVFGVRLLLAYLIPDVPGRVKMAMEREDYLRKRALEEMRDEEMKKLE